MYLTMVLIGAMMLVFGLYTIGFDIIGPVSYFDQDSFLISLPVKKAVLIWASISAVGLALFSIGLKKLK
jgi:hypothetical protein